ncbi:MAG: 50S ribosomal protein L11 [Nanoarchaeota archaeon]|nr:50S ribosomal protein L11 [Nanoarchaeota archaeon]MBU1270213.1 50S ribosomal protein L11 [Nanoarchaeota archaeon]MBU1604779.1 50S ribosomal protein L11 [Nanoarchaeota archaeon]MBU2442853.1 50S ribosomal protein L11 [Nanoarchaeota archaeon]
MAKQKIQVLIEGGKATAAPPLGPALGPLGVNIGQVIAEINKKTDSFKGMQVPVTVEVDPSTKAFSISVGTPPASALILKEAGVQKGSGRPQEELVADLVIEQIIKIAKMKEDALLGKTLKDKVKEIVGTCNSMGVKVEGVKASEAIKLINKGDFDEQILSGKTDLSEEERKQLAEERKHLQADLEAKHAKEEAKAKEIIGAMQGKERSAIVAKLREAEVHEDVISKLLPVEAPADAKGAPKSDAKPKK